MSSAFISPAFQIVPCGKVLSQLMDASNVGHVWIDSDQAIPVQEATRWSRATKSPGIRTSCGVMNQSRILLFIYIYIHTYIVLCCYHICIYQDVCVVFTSMFRASKHVHVHEDTKAYLHSHTKDITMFHVIFLALLGSTSFNHDQAYMH